MEGKLINDIGVNSADLEKLAVLAGVIIKPINFKEKFRIIVDYDPELPKTKIQYFTSE